MFDILEPKLFPLIFKYFSNLKANPKEIQTLYYKEYIY